MNFEHVTAQTTQSADGVDIAWYDFGGNGPDLILGHATGFCAMVWAPVAAALTQNFRCIAYDMRGHGLSGRPDSMEKKWSEAQLSSADSTQGVIDGWEWWRYALDIKAVLNASGATEVFGVGHSCGGASEVLLEEALPGTFRSLYLFEPVVFPVDPPAGPDPDRDLAIRARKRRSTFPSRDEALQTFSGRGPFVNLDPRCLNAYVDYGFKANEDGSLTLRCRPDDEAEVYVMASAHEGYSHLDTVKCPTTFARGAESVAFDEAHVRALADRAPDARFVTMPTVGHFGPLEQPEAFAAEVTKTFSDQ